MKNIYIKKINRNKIPLMLKNFEHEELPKD